MSILLFQCKEKNKTNSIWLNSIKVNTFNRIQLNAMQISEIRKNQLNFYKTQKTKNTAYRKNSLKRFQSVLIDAENEIYMALQNDLGKPEYEAFLTEYFVILSELHLMIKNLTSWSKPIRVKSSLVNFPSTDYLLPEPFGNCLQISPWNYPFQLSLATLIGAVAAGNTVVLKPSEHAPNTSSLLAKLIAKAFDPEHVTVVEGTAKEAQELLAERWDHITFTGSTKVGKIIAKAAAEHLTPTLLELGGKSPCIVDQTSPIKLTAKRIVWGKFLNCGQTCIAPDYLVVHHSIKNKLIEALKKEITNAYGENPAESESYGKIAYRTHFLRMQNLIDSTTPIFGGDFNENNLYFGPTLLELESIDHPSMKEEIFGPILPILSYNSEDELIQIINKFEKPLGFYVFSKRNKFIKKLNDIFSYGGGVANDSVIQFANNNLPFGGIGHSGMGSYHGKNSFRAYTHYKPFVKRGTWIDPFIRYAPYPKSFNWLKSVLKKI